MANLGEFHAAAREADPAREPDTFVLCGETFTIAEHVGDMPLLRFAAAAADGADSSTMAGMAAMHDMLRDCLADGDWPRFQDVCTRNRVGHETLFSIVNAVHEAVTGRPTSRPADSSAGPSNTGGSSRAASRAALGLVPVSDLLEQAAAEG